MNLRELKRSLHDLEARHDEQSKCERLKIAQMLMRSARKYVECMRDEMHESQVINNRRKLKSRETELDPKPPVKPVRVAEPSKPKKPKYSGNHAPKSHGR